MAKAKQAGSTSATAQVAQQAQAATTAPAKQEQVIRGTPVKALAKELGITGKKLRRYLRAQKFQRSGKLWDLPAKTVAAVREHFAKTEEKE